MYFLIGYHHWFGVLRMCCEHLVQIFFRLKKKGAKLLTTLYHIICMAKKSKMNNNGASTIVSMQSDRRIKVEIRQITAHFLYYTYRILARTFSVFFLIFNSELWTKITKDNNKRSQKEEEIKCTKEINEWWTIKCYLKLKKTKNRFVVNVIDDINNDWIEPKSLDLSFIFVFHSKYLWIDDDGFFFPVDSDRIFYFISLFFLKFSWKIESNKCRWRQGDISAFAMRQYSWKTSKDLCNTALWYAHNEIWVGSKYSYDPSKSKRHFPEKCKQTKATHRTISVNQTDRSTWY